MRQRQVSARRWCLVALIVLGITTVTASSAVAQKNYAPGVTDTEIKVGQTMPYSGPTSAWGGIGMAERAYFKMINDRGGINGRKINLISLDDGYTPSKAIEQTRKLIEQDQVAIVFGSISFGNLAVRKYLNDRHIPQLFVLTPYAKYYDPERFPWTIGILPTVYLDGQTHAKYIQAHKPNARIAVLYENNELGKEGLEGLRDGLGDMAKQLIVKEQSYELTDATVDSQMVTLRAARADTLYSVSSPKFATQAIRKASALGWKPLQLLPYGSNSIVAVLEPAGLDNAVGVISTSFAKDPSDPRWRDDQSVKDLLDWLKNYYPGGKLSDTYVGAGFTLPQPLVYVLKRCGDDLSRENIMRQATNLHGVAMPWLLPGLTLNTSPTDYQPIKQLREMRFNGKTWELLNEDN
jgi:branched-chain amino acid transport system substrate-binding protein